MAQCLLSNVPQPSVKEVCHGGPPAPPPELSANAKGSSATLHLSTASRIASRIVVHSESPPGNTAAVLNKAWRAPAPPEHAGPMACCDSDKSWATGSAGLSKLNCFTVSMTLTQSQVSNSGQPTEEYRSGGGLIRISPAEAGLVDIAHAAHAKLSHSTQ